MTAVLCQCGHDLTEHSGSFVAGRFCKRCTFTDQGYPTGQCMGWEPVVPATTPTPGVWEQVEGALPHLGPGAPSPEAQQQVERVMATTPTTMQAVAGPPPDPAWDDNAPEPPLLERVAWRIGVLDKDLFESPRDVEAHALLIAGWYVHDCAGLLAQLEATQDDRDSLAITWNDECQNLRGRLIQTLEQHAALGQVERDKERS